MMGDNHSESQETTSSSSEDSLNISFENINFTVRNRIFSKERKVILSNLSGTFKAGDLTVIVGQSGAGKSTLMDILAGYTKPTSGTIYVNGRIRDEKKFRRRSCYILQDDKVQEMLTVSESLAIAAELKLGDHVSKQQKKQRVEEIIISLTLNDARNTRAGNLSGGQKKRLAIGLELVSDPPVMFLDEPISGLDSSTSKYTVNLLHLLARQGRTVVITMHQPSPALLQMVDRLYAVVAGRCAYMGLEKQLLPYLEQLNLECPKHYNTVDFLIEISMDNADELVRLSRNGQNTDWTSVTPQKTDYNLAETSNLIIRKDIYLTTLPAPKEDPTNKILSKLKSTYSTSFWRQFVTLTRRALLTIWRNPSLTYMITGIHCAMALFIGFLFYNIGEDAKYFRQNFNFLYFSLMFLMYTAFSVVSINFPEQFPVVRREHFNRWYSTGAYYAASLVSALPTQTVCTLTYTFIAYWLTGQPCDPVRFFGFCWTVLMVSYVALCLGLLNGAMFNIKHAVIFGPFFVMPFVVFSGFFLYYNDAPFYLKWLFHVSFLKYGLAGLVISIIGLDRPKLPCSILYCHYAYPKQFLIDTGMIHDTFSIVVVALYSILFVIILCTYFVLKIRLKRKW